MNYVTAYDYLLAHRDTVANIPELAEPGVYAIFAANQECLKPITISRTELVYIGLATDLEMRNHFKAKSSGFHSPRRSLGAILKDRLNLKATPRADGPSETNYQSYSFEPDSEKRLTEWMVKNLEYSIYTHSNEVRDLEKNLIGTNEPPLNLTRWPNPQKRLIQDFRNACKEEAKTVWLKMHG